MTAQFVAMSRHMLCSVMSHARTTVPIPVRSVFLSRHATTVAVHGDGDTYTLDFSDMALDEWRRWGCLTAATWWAVSEPLVQTHVDDEPFAVPLVNHAMQLVWSDEVTRIYARAGQGLLYWMCDGLQDWEALPIAAGLDYSVMSVVPLTPHEQVRIRELVIWKHPGEWALSASTEHSTTMSARFALEDAVHGNLKPTVLTVAAWLREVLPTLKIGAPSVNDVQQKLRLERRLRMESAVVGSPRALAFTVEAIEEPVTQWPGLWLTAGVSSDVRTHFPMLLVWDAVLQVLNAATRAHVEVKPGLWIGDGLSRTIVHRERRFSKREVATTDAAYAQINPEALQEGAGEAAVIAARMIQLASHELAHLATGCLEQHTELWTRRREQIQYVGQTLIPMVTDLVRGAGLMGTVVGVSAAPFTPVHTWLHDCLVRQPVITMTQLVQSWRAVRFLTEGKAERDVVTEIERVERLGHLYRRDGLVVSTLSPCLPM